MTAWSKPADPASNWSACATDPVSVWNGCGPEPTSAWRFPDPPTLTSLTPASGDQGTSVPVVLRGTWFGPDSVINVSGAGITVAALVIVSATEIHATFVVDIAALATARTVSVTTGGLTTTTEPFTVVSTAFTFSTTAGIVTIDGLYTVVTFDANDTFNVLTGIRDIQYLVVAGGGSGGGVNGSGVNPGGGGGGGVVPGTDLGVTPGAYPVLVGAGGVGLHDLGSNGIDSTFNGHTATGGGAGGSIAQGRAGNNGGSGGGGGSQNSAGVPTAPGTGVVGQGNTGGHGNGGGVDGGGGGGASQAGFDGGLFGNPTSAKGGDGVVSAITGANVTYGGGGGGAGSLGAIGGGGTAGGPGGAGGGAAGKNGGPANSGTDGLGGGGGGIVGNQLGGNGGKGRVILRFLT